MFDLETFGLKEMVECSKALRTATPCDMSMEQKADRVVRYLHENLVVGASQERAIPLVRFFKTHPYAELGPELRSVARGMAGEQDLSDVKCLVLLGSAGILSEWNGRQHSAGHQAIPLFNEQSVRKSPMIWQLIRQLGLEIDDLLHLDPHALAERSSTNYKVFHIQKAVGSPFIPEQDDFVIRHGIKSVLGFGGMLPSGNLFAVLMFSRFYIPHNVAALFRSVALSVKMAVLPFDDQHVFSNSQELAASSAT